MGTRTASPVQSVEFWDHWFSTQQIAVLYGVSYRTVLRMIREGRLQAQKVGWVWMIHEDWLPTSWPPPVRR
jgi:excisionase family DNA binding protein